MALQEWDMTPEEITEAAERLYRAERNRKQTSLLSIKYPEMTMEDAYAVQAELVQKKIASGRKVIGWKIGLTSKAMQAALNIDIPDSGVLFDDMVFANGASVPADRFIQPRIEAEIAFVMKHPLSGPDVTVPDVLAATDYVVPALEILDTRIFRQDAATGKSRSIYDTISDNAANGGIVVGDQRIDPSKTDMRWIGAIVSKGGEVEETGLGAGVLNDPAMGIVWLANRLAEYGDSIKAGEIVLSGSFIRPVEADHAGLIGADFGPYGTVSCTFD